MLCRRHRRGKCTTRESWHWEGRVGRGETARRVGHSDFRSLEGISISIGCFGNKHGGQCCDWRVGNRQLGQRQKSGDDVDALAVHSARNAHATRNKHTLQMDQNELRGERQQQRGVVDDVKCQVSFAICMDDARVSRMARRRFINKVLKRLVGYLL